MHFRQFFWNAFDRHRHDAVGQSMQFLGFLLCHPVTLNLFAEIGD